MTISYIFFTIYIQIWVHETSPGEVHHVHFMSYIWMTAKNKNKKWPFYYFSPSCGLWTPPADWSLNTSHAKVEYLIGWPDLFVAKVQIFKMDPPPKLCHNTQIAQLPVWHTVHNAQIILPRKSSLWTKHKSWDAMICSLNKQVTQKYKNVSFKLV